MGGAMNIEASTKTVVAPPPRGLADYGAPTRKRVKGQAFGVPMGLALM
jgi:hypothetical protein